MGPFSDCACDVLLELWNYVFEKLKNAERMNIEAPEQPFDICSLETVWFQASKVKLVAVQGPLVLRLLQDLREVALFSNV